MTLEIYVNYVKRVDTFTLESRQAGCDFEKPGFKFPVGYNCGMCLNGLM